MRRVSHFESINYFFVSRRADGRDVASMRLDAALVVRLACSCRLALHNKSTCV